MTSEREARHRLFSLPAIKDGSGCLGFVQTGDQVPFEIKRIFYLYGIAAGAARGGHAHRAQHQFLIQLAGRCRITIDDGRMRHIQILENPAQGLYVPPMLWLDLDEFSADGVCLVLTSDIYDETDYIRDGNEFGRLTT